MSAMLSIDDILKEMGGKSCSGPPKTVKTEDVSKASIDAFQDWIADEAAVSLHFNQFNLEKKLGPRSSISNSRVVKIRNVLPANVADGAWALLKKCSDWDVSDAANDTGKKDYGAGTTRHRFSATAGNYESQHKSLTLLYKALSNLLPGKEYAFQGAKYGSGDFIEPHDDAAYIDVDVVSSSSGVSSQQTSVLHSRSIAIVFYLCKRWTAEDGGSFVDLQGGQVIVPEFNTLVAFHVPRLHSVEAVRTHQKYRYSIFGWFLEPGKLYQLASGDNGPSNNRKKKRNKHKNKHVSGNSDGKRQKVDG